MSRSYFTEDQKVFTTPFAKWTFDECLTIHEIMYEKGYHMNCVSRMGSDRKYHDAWQVEREDVPRLVEQLFRQRLVFEAQAEGHGKASINFVYDYSAETIINAVSRFWKNKRSDEL